MKMVLGLEKRPIQNGCTQFLDKSILIKARFSFIILSQVHNRWDFIFLRVSRIEILNSSKSCYRFFENLLDDTMEIRRVLVLFNRVYVGLTI